MAFNSLTAKNVCVMQLCAVSTALPLFIFEEDRDDGVIKTFVDTTIAFHKTHSNRTHLKAQITPGSPRCYKEKQAEDETCLFLAG